MRVHSQPVSGDSDAGEAFHIDLSILTVPSLPFRALHVRLVLTSQDDLRSWTVENLSIDHIPGLEPYRDMSDAWVRHLSAWLSHFHPELLSQDHDNDYWEFILWGVREAKGPQEVEYIHRFAVSKEGQRAIDQLLHFIYQPQRAAQLLLAITVVGQLMEYQFWDPPSSEGPWEINWFDHYVTYIYDNSNHNMPTTAVHRMHIIKQMRSYLYRVLDDKDVAGHEIGLMAAFDDIAYQVECENADEYWEIRLEREDFGHDCY